MDWRETGKALIDFFAGVNAPRVRTASPVDMEEIEAIRRNYSAWSQQSGPCDRIAAERAVCGVYRAMNRPDPRFLWLPSPMEAALVTTLWDLLETAFSIASPGDDNCLIFSADAFKREQNRLFASASVIKPVPVLKSIFLQNQFLSACANSDVMGRQHGIWDDNAPPEFSQAYHQSVDRAVAEQLWESLNKSKNLDPWLNLGQETIDKFESVDQQSAFLWRKFGELFWDLEDSKQRNILETARHHLGWDIGDFETGFRLGNGDAWRCFVVEDAVNSYKPNAVMLAMRETVRECGWWRPAERICFMLDRPTTLELDPNSELHRFDGKAVEYSDGFGLYAIHGIVVSEDIAYGRFNCDDIENAENQEMRRVMIDRFGAENYLQATGATELHRDQCGVLYIKEVPRDEPIVMVKVTNSTAEPDGSFKEYFLRVPPNTRTAREGIAWTFGMAEYEYKPGLET